MLLLHNRYAFKWPGQYPRYLGPMLGNGTLKSEPRIENLADSCPTLNSSYFDPGAGFVLSLTQNSAGRVWKLVCGERSDNGEWRNTPVPSGMTNIHNGIASRELGELHESKELWKLLERTSWAERPCARRPGSFSQSSKTSLPGGFVTRNPKVVLRGSFLRSESSKYEEIRVRHESPKFCVSSMV